MQGLWIAAVIGVALFLAGATTLSQATKAGNANRVERPQQRYTKPSFSCPYAHEVQCDKLDTSTMDKLDCKKCEHYPKSNKP